MQVTILTTTSMVAILIFAASLLALFATKSKWVTPALILVAALIGGLIHIALRG